MDRLYDTGVNAAIGGIHKFAKSDYLQRKIPMLAPMVGNAADALKKRLDQGYQSMANGGTPGGVPGSQQSSAGVPMDGIERQRY